MRSTLADAVRLPNQSFVEAKLVHFLYRYNRPVGPKELYGPVADALGLTQEQRSARYPVSREMAWPTLLRQARRRLVSEGLSDPNARRGFWQLTPKGRERGRSTDGSPEELL
jgi:hypothetical protein